MADFSPTRTHASWKPRTTLSHIPFFICEDCGHVYANLDDAKEIELINDGERSLRIDLPYGHEAVAPSCHGKEMKPLAPINWEEVDDRIHFDYKILGGYNNNCTEISWKVGEPGCEPKWFALKTFTGMQMKYVQPKKWPPIVFAFADEDAFAYCDRNPCLECQFRCKTGMELYCYVPKIGLICRSMDRISMVKAGLR
ncbi:MAG: hypothetical protein Q4A43_02050 [Coriobacteriia bacterium]|nr:hypothetical protein [Coriobacteriia bacterium]